MLPDGGPYAMLRGFASQRSGEDYLNPTLIFQSQGLASSLSKKMYSKAERHDEETNIGWLGDYVRGLMGGNGAGPLLSSINSCG